ncbi:MAG: hypothetical protein K9K79_12625 [Desulfohalobiaceae bacterium]|nr:hypothetical protein [Desulfohalobiaceae bacterium]
MNEKRRSIKELLQQESGGCCKMIRDKKEAKDWELLHSTEDPVKRRALLSSIVSRRLEEQGFPKPIIVGGEALEIYSSGQFTTGDIDIKAPLEELRSILSDMGFVHLKERAGHEDLKDSLDEILDLKDSGEREEPFSTN